MTARAAVIGAGPSGFYATEQLLRAGVAVDLFDALPTPFGLVRAGVAPDHPKIKSVTRMFERTAEHPRFRFFGGVQFGADVTRDELLERYHALVYAVGTPTAKPARDRRRRPAGVGRRHGVRRLVQRPSGARRHGVRPVMRARRRDRQRERGARRRADAGARPADELAPTDIADHALASLSAASVTDVVILGRRGPAQATFTNPELRELGELARADVLVDAAEVDLEPGDASPTARRNVAMLRDYAARAPAREVAPDRAALLPLAGRDPRRGGRAGDRAAGGAYPARAGRGRRSPGGGDGRAGSDSLRAGDPRDRVPRTTAARGAVRRAPRPDP